MGCNTRIPFIRVDHAWGESDIHGIRMQSRFEESKDSTQSDLKQFCNSESIGVALALQQRDLAEATLHTVPGRADPDSIQLRVIQINWRIGRAKWSFE